LVKKTQLAVQSGRFAPINVVVRQKMGNQLPRTVLIPWIESAIQVECVLDEVTGEESQALAEISNWTDSLKVAIERACFANYLEKIEDIGVEPPTVPVIKFPAEVWNHIEIESVRAQGKDLVVVYVVPAWDIDLQQEWCVEGTSKLHYVGQFLDYSPEAYRDIDTFNSAKNCEEIIARLAHIPLAWA
jgi:hypothetical protein